MSETKFAANCTAEERARPSVHALSLSTLSQKHRRVDKGPENVKDTLLN